MKRALQRGALQIEAVAVAKALLLKATAKRKVLFPLRLGSFSRNRFL